MYFCAFQKDPFSAVIRLGQIYTRKKNLQMKQISKNLLFLELETY
jgi:hypothetical protein